MNPLMMAMQGGTPAAAQANPGMDRVAGIMKMLRSGNPEQIAQQMLQQNPQFRAFVQANQGKSPEQVAREHGVDLSALMKQV